MKSNRLEALTDGVVAIVITIIVLDLKIPDGGALGNLSASLPTLLTYALSFVTIGDFWNNHHHMLQGADRVDGRVLWANLFFLFWLSLIPFVIRWLDESSFSEGATAAYGFVLGMAATGYQLTTRAIIACGPANAAIARAIGRDLKGKFSLVFYAVGVAAAFASPAAAMAIYVGVILVWLVPDRRIERALNPVKPSSHRETLT